MALAKGNNPNHPQPGDIIKVDPIRDLKAIKRIKTLLASNPTHSALFQVGINTAFRASDLLRLTPAHVTGNVITIREQKTGKVRTVTVNEPTLESLRALQLHTGIANDVPYFQGQRGTLSVPYVNALVKSWCRNVGLAGNYGSHTLRKTWGYQMRTAFKVELPLLMDAFGHASQRQTLTYLCIEQAEVQNLYSNAI